MSDFDALLDKAHELGCLPGKHLRWGVAADGECWIELVLPDKKCTSHADSLEFAAWSLMWSEFPPADDVPEAV